MYLDCIQLFVIQELTKAGLKIVNINEVIE